MAQFSGKSFGLTLRHKGRVAEIVCALEGGARCPRRAVGGRESLPVSDIFGSSRGGEDTAPCRRSVWATGHKLRRRTLEFSRMKLGGSLF